MHPDLEQFLEDAFASVQPSSPAIGRVVVEPDYDVAPDPKDARNLASELVQCLREAKIDKTALASHEGFEIQIPSAYRLLRRYVRSVTLHANTIEGEWIEVAPPGNWI